MVVEAPAPETFQAGLDRSLSALGWLKMSLLTAGGWVPSDTNYSMIRRVLWWCCGKPPIPSQPSPTAAGAVSASGKSHT